MARMPPSHGECQSGFTTSPTKSQLVRGDDAGPFGLIHLCCETAVRQQK